MMYVIYDIGCQSLHGCEWRCRCFLSLFRQLCKCSFFVLCYMWPDTPLGLFSAPALKVIFLCHNIMVLLRSLELILIEPILLVGLLLWNAFFGIFIIFIPPPLSTPSSKVLRQKEYFNVVFVVWTSQMPSDNELKIHDVAILVTTTS